MKKVTIYRTSWCPFCQRAEGLLDSKNLDDYEIIDVDDQPQAKSEMIEKAGGKTSVPQIFIGGKHIGGCDDLFALESAGELDPMLAN